MGASVKPKIRMNTRDMDICSRAAQSEDLRTIAASYGLTRTRIYQIVRKTENIIRWATEPRSEPKRHPTGIMLGGVAYMTGPPPDLYSNIELPPLTLIYSTED